jgi:hypothetical protein
MLLVYSAPNLLMVGHIRNLLEVEGIPSLIKNEFLSGAAGELPPTEAWPELWVIEPCDHERAREIVAHALREPSTREPWVCPDCGERIEGQFTDCWKCGYSRL